MVMQAANADARKKTSAIIWHFKKQKVYKMGEKSGWHTAAADDLSHGHIILKPQLWTSPYKIYDLNVIQCGSITQIVLKNSQ